MKYQQVFNYLRTNPDAHLQLTSKQTTKVAINALRSGLNRCARKYNDYIATYKDGEGAFTGSFKIVERDGSVDNDVQLEVYVQYPDATNNQRVSFSIEGVTNGTQS